MRVAPGSRAVCHGLPQVLHRTRPGRRRSEHSLRQSLQDAPPASSMAINDPAAIESRLM